jgi:hypothetical protein
MTLNGKWVIDRTGDAETDLSKSLALLNFTNYLTGN